MAAEDVSPKLPDRLGLMHVQQNIPYFSRFVGPYTFHPAVHHSVQSNEIVITELQYGPEKMVPRQWTLEDHLKSLFNWQYSVPDRVEQEFIGSREVERVETNARLGDPVQPGGFQIVQKTEGYYVYYD